MPVLAVQVDFKVDFYIIVNKILECLERKMCDKVDSITQFLN